MEDHKSGTEGGVQTENAGSLDDFFAKKDKTKKKKNKLVPSDLMKEKSKKKKDNKKSQESSLKPTAPMVDALGADQLLKTHDDEQWQDFDDAEKDYSGLKIANLNINQDKDDDSSGSEEINEDGVTTRKSKKKGDNVWGVKESKQEEQKEDVVSGEDDDDGDEEDGAKSSDDEETVGCEAPDEPSKPSTYVPPHLRNRPAASATQPQRKWQGGRGGKMVAPDIQSEEAFPSLGGGPGPAAAPGARSSSRGSGDANVYQAPRGPRLDTENRYNALSR